MNKSLAVFAVALATSAMTPAFAAMDHGSMGGHANGSAQMAQMSGHDMSKMSDSKSMAMTEGVVKKVDAAAGKVTLQHTPLKNLDMPAMTMVFKLKDPSWAADMKVGDKIKFVAENSGGVLTVVQYEKSM